MKADALMDLARMVVAGTENAERERADGGALTIAWVLDLDDGRRAWVYRMLFGNARLCIGAPDAFAYDEGYCYRGIDAAVTGAVRWIAAGASGEPDGWIKNLQTQEYREP